jgi:glycosyltransferase involved in cell wall biosynthesis
MKISVIIPTYNRSNLISSPLEAIANQSMIPDEVIVVIDGSKDNTKDVVERYSSKLAIKIIEIPNGGRSVARNVGVKHSTGDLIIFLDDDMRPFPEFIRDHHLHHQKHPGSLFGGAIREDENLFKTDIQKWRLTLYERKGWVTAKQNDDLTPLREENLYLAAANFSISLKSFNDLGGFDEQLRDTEDFDLGIRALKAGYDVFGSNSTAFAFHDDLITCRTYILRHRQHLVSQRMLKKLKPDLYTKRIKDYSKEISGIKKILFSIFSWKVSVDIVDSGLLKWIMPRSIRYKFYDMVIGGLSNIFPERKF